MEIIQQHHKLLKNRLYAISLLLAAFPLVSPNSYAVSTFVLGNMANPPIQVGSGPTDDGTINIYYPSNPTVVFSRTSELAPANVKINWSAGHGTATSNMSLYCTMSDKGTGNGFSIESGYISAGSYGGVNIFKTNIAGLYFSVNLRSFSSDGEATTNISNVDIRDGIMHSVIQLTPTSETVCKKTNTTGEVNYATSGGFTFYSSLTFYTDQTYTPGSSSITLLKKGNYDFRLWNENPGSGIKSNYVNVIYDISGVVVSEPTCSAQPVASGSSVSGSTVDLGHYSPNDIIKGAAAVPFAINLAGCKGLRNIDVTLSSTTVASDPTMLGNILSSNKATGIGLEIAGAANKASTQTVIIPNDTSSVYHDQRDTSGDDNIYGSNENGKVQTHTLNFLATLKRDGNQSIGSGNFKATGTFTINYP